tara:strand:+ start:8532 stop:8708 length:177 start_codon:yes stop_codon:yes gene_type:complete
MSKSSPKLLKTVKKYTLATLPVVGGISLVALGVRYFGDKPVVSDIAKGLKGDVVGLFQ